MKNENKAKNVTFFDAHCHLQAGRLLGSMDEVVGRAKDAGVAFMVCCGSIERDWETVRAISDRLSGVIPAFGLHPMYLEGYTDQWVDRLASFLESRDAGIGEIGLDFMDRRADRDLQERLFERQLALAKEMNLPVTLHVRKAWDRFIHIMKRTGSLPAGGLVHSYSGSADMVPLFESFGLYISFSGSVTRPNARKVKEAITAVSKDKLLVETDSPDIFPSIPGRELDEVNEPANLPFIAKVAAGILDMGFESFAGMVYENGMRLFKMVIEKRGGCGKGEGGAQ